MKIKLLSSTVIVFAVLSILLSCSHSDKNPPMPVQATLYDTLGWFIQGGSAPTIAGQGGVMIKDPDANQGTGTIEAGRLAIRTLIDTAVFVIAGDPKMAPYFPTLLGEVGSNKFTGYYALSKNFTDLVQDVLNKGASGYTPKYGGKSMVAAHNFSTNSRFGSSTTTVVKADDFDQFMNDVVTAANKLKIPSVVTNRLGGILGSLKPVIVQN